MLAMQARDEFKNQLSSAPIEITGRFIGEEHLRLRDECASQCEPLLLATREFARAMMPAFRQSHLSQPARSFLLSR